MKLPFAFPPRRVLLKLSGEALAGEGVDIFDPAVFVDLVEDLKVLTREAKVQVGIVVGGGNIYRGARAMGMPIGRVEGDAIGMLATCINALALKASFETSGLPARAMGSREIPGVLDGFDPHRAIELLEEGRVVIFGGGTGNPFFTTDTAAALKALEIRANLFLKGTRVPGVFTADPEKDPSARHLPFLTYEEILEKKLGVMDLTSITLCRENHLPVAVFSMADRGLSRLLQNQGQCTWIFSPA